MNILVAVDANAEADLKEARELAAQALDRYVTAMARMAELEAIRDLRRAMGAELHAADSVSMALTSTARGAA